MSAADIADEYRRALLATKPDDLLPLSKNGISAQTITAVAPAIARITVTGPTYQPDPCGGIAFLLPVRVESPVTPEADDPVETIRIGSIVDILAFHPTYRFRFALRRDTGEWLGAIEPQHLEPPPVHVWRSPIDWLRAGCRGLVILSREPADAYRILTGCRGGILVEDAEYAAELQAILERPWPLPCIIVASGPCGAT
jgi:hypothetical protein